MPFRPVGTEYRWHDLHRTLFVGCLERQRAPRVPGRIILAFFDLLLYLFKGKPVDGSYSRFKKGDQFRNWFIRAKQSTPGWVQGKQLLPLLQLVERGMSEFHTTLA